tara:strand:+ start:1171 stop:1428 length:258 start_codon:yes stop_codon:yes gene_type:complete
MNALEFLNNKGIKTPTVNTTRLPDGEFGLHSVTDLMDEYLEYKLKNLSQHIVSKSFTPKQIVELLKEEETLDDAISFFTHQSNVC